ncbi:MAG TPA: Xaa-Pro peptidase family protein, partial [Thermoleophilaceae bacterium]|nr:Xaa-Pro peptidase family protein [Thermoleophilaceae bacterium]
QFRTDYESRPDLQALREARLARVQLLLSESDLDALLVWKDENVRYLTGMRAQLISGKTALLNGCLLVQGRDPIMLISGGDLERAKNAMTWIEEFHPIPILEAGGLIRGTVEDTLAPLLRRHGIDGGRVGIDECAYSQVKELQAALPHLMLEDGDSLMHSARLVKFGEEIALMEEAAAIAEAVTETALQAVAPGVRETEVAAEAMRTLYRLGGEMAHVSTPFVASGEHMAPPNRLCTDKIIREGDLVFIDIGAMWSGYFADIGRTTVCGAPSRRQQEVYTAVYHALEAGRAAMRPGNTNDDVAAAIVGVARERGLAEHFISLFIGHGVGAGANEPPYVGEQLPGADRVDLEVGMTFALEPLIWVPGVRGGAGVRLEDTIMVDVDGGRPLTRTAFDERLIV